MHRGAALRTGEETAVPSQGERTQMEPPGDVLILNFQPPDREKCISVVWACLGCFRTEPPWAPTEAAARRGQTPSWGPLPGHARWHTRPPRFRSALSLGPAGSDLSAGHRETRRVAGGQVRLKQGLGTPKRSSQNAQCACT